MTGIEITEDLVADMTGNDKKQIFVSHIFIYQFSDLKDKMDQLVGEINGRFSTPRWSPIRYIFGCINQVT